MLAVGHALTAVGALDPVTAEEILTDFRLAVSVRHLHSEPGQGPGQAVTVAQWLARAGPVLHAEAAPGPVAGEDCFAEEGGGRTGPTGSSRSG